MGLIKDKEGKEFWKPNHRQSDFLRIPDTVFEGFYGGAAFGGKSEVLLMYPCVKGWINNPLFRGIIFRKTFPQLEESLIPTSKVDLAWERVYGAKYNDQKHYWSFPSGATIRFSYMEADADARQHDTAHYHYAAFDELTHFTEYQYTYISSRVRTITPDLPRIMRSASNPGNIGHSWVRARFVDPFPQGNVLIFDELTKEKRIFIPAKITDNPYGLDADPNYANRLMLLPEAERKAKIEGDWYSFFGQVFTEFRERHHEGEPANAVHVIDPFSVPEWYPKVVALDWGFRANTWAGLAAIAPDNRIIVMDEYICKKKSIKEYCAEIRQRWQHVKGIRAFELDPSAWAKRGDERTIAQQICDATEWLFHKADNDRLGGKLLIHDLLRWKPRPAKYIPREGYKQETCNTIYRMYGPSARDEYLSLFTPEIPETNIPRLQIFRGCKEVVKVIQLCTYDEEARSNKKAEDVKEFDGDDAYDGLRYLLKACERFQNECIGLAAELERRNVIIGNFNATKDYTGFYRSMEKLERDERKPDIIGRYGQRFGGETTRARSNRLSRYH